MITRCLLTRTFFYMECTYRVMKMFLKVQQHFEYWLTKKGTSIFRWCSLCVLCWICYKHRMQLAAWVVEREFFFSVRLLSVERGHSFFSSRHNGQWPPTLKDFYTRSYPLHYFLILILEKEPVFPLSMLSAKQGRYWYHFYNVCGMTRSLTGDWTRDLRSCGKGANQIRKYTTRQLIIHQWK